MFSIFVKNEVKNGCREQYLSIMKSNAQASVRDEKGCMVFDVLIDQENDHTFYLYEIYADEAALAQHKQMPHYLESRKLLGDMVECVSVIRCDVVDCNASNTNG